MLTLVAEVVIDLVFVASVVAIVSCLAYLLSLTVREHKESKAVVHWKAPEREPASVGRQPVRSLRPGIARHQSTPSG